MFRRNDMIPSLFASAVLVSVSLIPFSAAHAAPSLSGLSLQSPAPSTWSKYEMQFSVNNSVATNQYWSYSDNAAGLPDTPQSSGFYGTGISVDAEFLPPNKQWTDTSAILVQPCFLYQPFTVSGGAYQPAGSPTWRLRYAFSAPGTWQRRFRLRDASGTTVTTAQNVVVASSTHPGYVRVSPNDKRYFERFNNTERRYLPLVGGNSQVGGNANSEWPANYGSGKLNLLRTWWQGSNGDRSWCNISGQGNLQLYRDPNGTPMVLTSGVGQSVPDNQRFFYRRMWSNPDVGGGTTICRAECPVVSLKNATYTVQATVRSNLSGSGASLQLWIEGFSTTSTGYKAAALGSGWQTLTATVTASGATAPRVQVHGINATGGSFDVARIRVLENGNANLDYCLGEVERYRRYSQEACAKNDALLDQAESLGVALRVVLFDKEDTGFNGITNAGIGVNGFAGAFYGESADPNLTTNQRWVQEQAIRYAQARWMWSPAFAMAEWANEVSQTVDQSWAGASWFGNKVHEISSKSGKRVIATTSAEDWHSVVKGLWFDPIRTGATDVFDVHAGVFPTGGAPEGLQNAYWLQAPAGVDRSKAPYFSIAVDPTNASNRVLFGEKSSVGRDSIHFSPIAVKAGKFYKFRYRIKWDRASWGTNYWYIVPSLRGRTYAGGVDTVQLPVAQYNWAKNTLIGDPEGTGPMWAAQGGWLTFESDIWSPSQDDFLTLDLSVGEAWTGKIYLDDVELQEVNSQGALVQSLPPYNGNFEQTTSVFEDTALFSQTTGGSYNTSRLIAGKQTSQHDAPFILGEVNLVQLLPDPNEPGKFVPENPPALFADTNSVWLRKLLGSLLGPEAVHPTFWANTDVAALNGDMNLVGAYRAFAESMRFNEGGFVDANATTTNGLRAFGQKRFTDGKAALFVDAGAGKSWLNVVNSTTGGSVTGNVTMTGLPNGSYVVTRYNPATVVGGVWPIASTSMETVVGNTLTLGFTALPSDAIVKIEPIAPIVVGNSSFENPSVANSNIWAAFKYAGDPLLSGNAWMFSGNSGIAHNLSGFLKPNVFDSVDAPHLSQVGFLQSQPGQGAAEISQSIPGFIGGVTYTIRVASIQRKLNGAWNSQSVEVQMDGVSLGVLTPAAGTSASELVYTYNCPTSGSHTLKLKGGTFSSDQTVFVDNVRIVGAP